MLSGGYLELQSANFTRPADTNAYASGDLVANSVTATAVVPLSFSGGHRFSSGGAALLRGVCLQISDTTITNGQFRIHFWGRKSLSQSESPTFANGDNSAFSTNNVAQYIGQIDVTLTQAFTDGAWGIGVPSTGTERPIDLGGANKFFCAIEARAAYTPVSAEVFTVTPYILQL